MSIIKKYLKRYLELCKKKKKKKKKGHWPGIEPGLKNKTETIHTDYPIGMAAQGFYGRL
jgi:hypothetical protein